MIKELRIPSNAPSEGAVEVHPVIGGEADTAERLWLAIATESQVREYIKNVAELNVTGETPDGWFDLYVHVPRSVQKEVSPSVIDYIETDEFSAARKYNLGNRPPGAYARVVLAWVFHWGSSPYDVR